MSVGVHSNPRALRGCLGIALIAALAACGGKSVSDRGPLPLSGGGSSDQDAGSSPLDAGGAPNKDAGPPTSVCPSTPPNVGDACNFTGPECDYYGTTPCSEQVFQCVDGTWQPATYNTGTIACPLGTSSAPHNGEGCGCLEESLDCTFDDCNGQGLIRAVCHDTTWQVSTKPCTSTPCGPAALACKPDELCVLTDAYVGPPSYACQPNPCLDWNSTAACSCAGSLCQGQHSCIDDPDAGVGTTVHCALPK